MATIQGGPRTARSGDYNQRSPSPDRAWSQLAGKFGARRIGSDGPRTDGSRRAYTLLSASRRLGRNRPESGELRR
jgi:hypothetical protein